MMSVQRIIDANTNRVSEGLRVIEDVCRFIYENKEWTDEIRCIRHQVRKNVEQKTLIHHRETTTDFGLEISASNVLDQKTDVEALVTANFKRVQEGLRTIEECLKVMGNNLESKVTEQIRFKAYALEKSLLTQKRFPDTDIYGILGEDFSNGIDNIEMTKRLVASGIKIIQYREKHKSKQEKLEQCQKIIAITKPAGVTFVVNDDIDIALSVGAEGLHLGQDDLPIELARKIAPHMMIGVSTHNPDQAQKAVADGADYIGVGPIYPTTTKVNVASSEGLSYLEWIAENIQIPHVAIGGIKAHNIKAVQDVGGSCFAIISELVGSQDTHKKTREIRAILNK